MGLTRTYSTFPGIPFDMRHSFASRGALEMRRASASTCPGAHSSRSLPFYLKIQMLLFFFFFF